MLLLIFVYNHRCTHYNQDLSRRGAARLLELVLALLPPSTTNTSNSNSNQQQQQEQEQVSSADGGGFLRSYFNSPPAAGTDYCGGSTSTGRAALRYSGPVGAAPVPVFSSATSTIATATATATASNGGVDPSPRKARRQKSLKAAFYRGT